MELTSLRLLIVDDSNVLRNDLKNLLLGLDFKDIYEATNGVQAKDLLIKMDQANTPIQMVLSDLQMPEMDGVELLRYVREELKWITLPFILVTSHDDLGKIAEAARLGMSNYIVKPVNAKILKQKISESIDRRGPSGMFY